MVTLMELQRLDQQSFQPNDCLGQNKCLRVSALAKRGTAGRHYYLSRLMTKPTKWHVRPAKTQISLGILPVWSESSLTALRNIRSLVTHWAHSEYSEHTGRTHFFCWFCNDAAHSPTPLHRDKNPCIGRIGKSETHMFIFFALYKICGTSV